MTTMLAAFALLFLLHPLDSSAGNDAHQDLDQAFKQAAKALPRTKSAAAPAREAPGRGNGIAITKQENDRLVLTLLKDYEVTIQAPGVKIAVADSADPNIIRLTWPAVNPLTHPNIPPNAVEISGPAETAVEKGDGSRVGPTLKWDAFSIHFEPPEYVYEAKRSRVSFFGFGASKMSVTWFCLFGNKDNAVVIRVKP